MSIWQLPEGIIDLVGDEAAAFESWRRQLLDLYADRGFELVIPPMIEHIESLLLTSTNLDLKTFKFLDPASGKMLGVHADITPQIARIDAKRTNSKIQKYCYISAILQTKADDFYTVRAPIQAGAELYGSNDIGADIEIIELMLESLDLLNIRPIVLSLGSVAIFNALIAKQSCENQLQLRQIFQKRSIPDLDLFLQNNSVDNGAQFASLIRLQGKSDILKQGLTIFSQYPQAIAAIEDLIYLHEQLKSETIEVIYDLATLPNYEYHNGIIFSAFNSDYAKALAQGGRYNNLGAPFEQSENNRAATGFSFDLQFLSNSKSQAN